VNIKSKILATGSFLGTHEIPTQTLLEEAGFDKIGLPVNLIERELGITHVRHSADSVKPGDLAIAAVEIALKRSGVAVSEIDAVIFWGIDRDYSEPATAHRVAHELGINALHCWDQSDACHGFTTGIITANLLIASGQIRHALVCTGERSSSKARYISDLFKDNTLGVDDVQHTLGVFSLGDAGGAMVLGPTDNGSGIQLVNSRTNSSQSRLCFYDIFGAERGIKPSFGMEMTEICSKTIRLVKRMVPRTMKSLGWDYPDIDHLIQHQVGYKPYQVVLNMFRTPAEKSPATYARLGNLASASIPVCMEYCNIKPGDRAIINSTGSGIVATHLGLVF